MAATATLLLAAALGLSLIASPLPRIPEHLLGHRALYFDNFIRKEVAATLVEIMKQKKTFPTNVNDLQFYKTIHEHIGEARPVGADGTCDHPFLVPSSDRSLCILPGRIDVGRHFIKYGGNGGLKESYARLVSRVQSFGQYIFELDATMQGLFTEPIFLEAATGVCPGDKPHLDPFQFNYIMQVPGQTVAMHLDAPYFWGASRFSLPQWLLVCMVFSGLFRDRFVDQVQVVAYLHEWAAPDRGGSFVYWNDNTGAAHRVAPNPLSGSSMDGSKTVHAADVYMPETAMPVFDKSADNALVYLAQDRWALVSNNATLAEYATSDLRMTVVYRARCFTSPGEAELFRAQMTEPSQQLSLESILGVFAADLVRQGKMASVSEALSMDRLDLALLLLDTYAVYPLPQHSLMPYNYCALGRTHPGLAPILALFCD